MPRRLSDDAARPPPPARPDRPSVDAYRASHPATGRLVLEDGQRVIERHQNGRTAEMRFASHSMAKAPVGMAAGVAIRHVLLMSSGVAFDETCHRPGAGIAHLSRSWAAPGGASVLRALAQVKGRDAKPGERFRDICADTRCSAGCS